MRFFKGLVHNVEVEVECQAESLELLANSPQKLVKVAITTFVETLPP